MKKKLLKQLKSDYEELEISPSADLWNRIEQSSPENPVLSPKKRFQWLRYAAVLIVLFSLGMLLYFNQNDLVSNPGPIVKTTVTKDSHKIIPSSLPDLNVKAKETENKNTEEGPDYQPVRKPVQIPELPTKEEILEKSGMVLAKEEKIIIQPNEVNAPVLDGNIYLIPGKNNVADLKKTDYIKADELLQGREFDKKREENKTDIRKFGTLDMTKIKIKSPSPSSLKILGMTVFSDSLEKK